MAENAAPPLDDVAAAAAAALNGDAPTVPELDFFTLAELADSAKRERSDWLVERWWCHPSFGQAAGPEKTLKSWTDAVENVAIASGLPLFGEFKVVTPGPVVVFSGEITATLYWKRLRHIARAMGITDANFEKLPISITSQRAPITSKPFQKSLRAQLDREPVKVSLDPLYSYHGHDVEASNVHAAGYVLNHFSEPLMEARVSGKIVNHFKKGTGGGALSLESITQAGGREWVDSWVLMKHRAKPKMSPEANDFFLHMEVGSRQWGARSYDLDISLGGFDMDRFEHTGEMVWKIIEAEDTTPAPGETTRRETLEIVRAHGGKITVPELMEELDCSKSTATSKLNALVNHGLADVNKDEKPYVYEAFTEEFHALITGGAVDSTHWKD